MTEEKCLVLLEDIVPLEFQAGGSLAPLIEGIDAAIPVEEIKKKRKYTKKDNGVTDGTEADVQPSSIEMATFGFPGVNQPSSIDVEPSSIDVEPSSIDVEPSSIDVAPSLIDVAPSSMDMAPSSMDGVVSSMEEAQSSIEVAQSSIDGAPSLIEEVQSLIEVAQSSIEEEQSLIEGAPSSTEGTSLLIEVVQSSIEGAESFIGGAPPGLVIEGASSSMEGTQLSMEMAPSSMEMVQSSMEMASSFVEGASSLVEGAFSSIEGAPLYEGIEGSTCLPGDELPLEVLDAKSKAAMRMRQYRKDHKNDPIWLSKEAERMRKIRAQRKSLSSNELQGIFVDENGVEISRPMLEVAVDENGVEIPRPLESLYIEGSVDENGVEIPRPIEVAPRKKRARKSKVIPQISSPTANSLASDLIAFGAVAIEPGIDGIAAVEVKAENFIGDIFMNNGINDTEGSNIPGLPGYIAPEVMGDISSSSAPPKKMKSDEFKKKEAERIRRYRELKRQDFEWKAKDAERMRVYRARLKEGAPEGRVKVKRAPSAEGGKKRQKRQPAGQNSSSSMPQSQSLVADLQSILLPLPYEPYEPEQYAQSSSSSTAMDINIKKEDSDSEDEAEIKNEVAGIRAGLNIEILPQDV